MCKSHIELHVPSGFFPVAKITHKITYYDTHERNQELFLGDEGKILKFFPWFWQRITKEL
jgi:hypothetical protein